MQSIPGPDPSDIWQAFKAGHNIHEALISYGNMRKAAKDRQISDTGKLRSLFENNNKKHEMQTSASLQKEDVMGAINAVRLKAIRDEEKQKRYDNEGKKERNTEPIEIYDEMTVLMPSLLMPALDAHEPYELDVTQEEVDKLVDASPILVSREVHVVYPQLDVDDLGRSYIEWTRPRPGEPHIPTIELAEQLVMRFWCVKRYYPVIIYLSGMRYLEVLGKDPGFRVGNMCIPYKYDGPSAMVRHYEMLVRDGRIDDWTL